MANSLKRQTVIITESEKGNFQHTIPDKLEEVTIEGLAYMKDVNREIEENFHEIDDELHRSIEY